ncbi:hypothetical protein [Thermogutta sp.]|uniref:tetratricopeptide repeat protein n=1 Tax=Thermogutta sp. TaxID=1962930 RepID=UPI003C7B4CB0
MVGKETPQEGFESLFDKLFQLNDKGYKRSAFRLAEEIRRRAREEKEIIPYLYANFHSMNCAQALFDHRTGRDRAVETIALLESEEKAREIQPDLPIDEYEAVIQWLTACAYDNLAKHHAICEGYGREELQGLIQEGFDVCRRTGKLQCLTCFREYAVNVYEAAGDLDLAMHFARSVYRELPLVEENDRRSVGALQYSRHLTMLGRLEEAREVAEASVRLAKYYHTPLEQRVFAQCQLGEILTLLGRREELEERCAVVGEPVDWTILPPREENPEMWLRRDLFEATELACAGKLAEALEILHRWDEWLASREVWSEWFEVRLRRISLTMLAQEAASAESLARPLRQEARRRKAWLYLTRLAAIERGVVPPSPVAFLKPPESGPFRQKGAKATEAESPPPKDEEQAISVERAVRQSAHDAAGAVVRDSQPETSADKASTSLGKQLDEWLERLLQEGLEPDDVVQVFEKMLAVDPESVENPEDGARLIYLAGQLSEMVGRQLDVWDWARRLLTRFPENGDVLNLVATAALSAWSATHQAGGEESPDSPPRESARDVALPSLEQIGTWFRKSLDLSPDYPRHYTRAAQFFRMTGDIGMAEWCLARSFALNRNNPQAVLGLAQIYSDADREQDALAVLDLCLRDGNCQDAEVAWEAGLVAFRLGRYPEALTYLNQSEQWGWNSPWLYFYRAWTLLSLKEAGDAQKDIERFLATRNEPGLAGHVLYAWLAQVQDLPDQIREHVKAVLRVRIQDIDDLSETGIEKNLQQLYEVARQGLPAEDEVLADLQDRLFQAGIVPDSVFEAERRNRPKLNDLNYYVCVCRQPLEESWSQHPACWPQQASWPAYFAFWGVLARNIEEAEHYVLQAQSRCYPGLSAELVSTTMEEGGFFDHPGVVWQGARRYDEDLEAIYSLGLGSDDADGDMDLDEDLDDDFDEDDDDFDSNIPPEDR